MLILHCTCIHLHCKIHITWEKMEIASRGVDCSSYVSWTFKKKYFGILDIHYQTCSCDDFKGLIRALFFSLRQCHLSLLVLYLFVSRSPLINFLLSSWEVTSVLKQIQMIPFHWKILQLLPGKYKRTLTSESKHIRSPPSLFSAHCFL